MHDAIATFRARLCEIVGEDRTAVLAALDAPRRAGFWLNPLRNSKSPVEQIAALGEMQHAIAPVPGLDGVYSVDAAHRDALTRSAAVEDGSVYVTNPSSVLAARCLEARPGEEVLDLAAAPGGKTLQLAAAMQNRGRIATVEAIKPRFHRMRANLSRCGVTIADHYLADGRTIGRKVPARFDRVLLDAPCSSEARIRSTVPQSFAHWSERKVKECARKQRGLLVSAFDALAPGGTLVYCTCTFAPEENELAVCRLLAERPDADIDALPEALVAAVPDAVRRPGITTWRDASLDARMSKALRILPDATWDGFFVCRIARR